MAKIFLSPQQRYEIDLWRRRNESFRMFYKEKRDITAQIDEEIHSCLYGRKPMNFVINITGLIGHRTGILKTSLAGQIALKNDPSFNVKERIGMTPQELLDKVKKYGKQRQIFMLDEVIFDFKMSSEQALANIINSCRERQLCFIICGVPEYNLTFSDYQFQRIGESSDELLNKKVKINGENVFTGEKTIYYAVSKKIDYERVFMGLYIKDITPLTDKKWAGFWSQYMVLKRIHQAHAQARNLTGGFDFRNEAKFIRKSKEYLDNCLDDDGSVIKAKVKNLVREKYPDLTNDERSMIYTEIIYPNKTEHRR